MRLKLYAGVAFAALVIPAAAHAQSTGSIEFENNDIVVTGSRVQEVAGTKIPDSGKTKVELTHEFLQQQTPGQSINETINMLPGVSFNGYDAYGSAGGSFTIRGFTSDRVSQTIDGMPINDTGNYAIYSNQQIDPELIDQVNVVLGSTDIDSPTASASGSTINYTTIMPTDEISGRLEGSIGDLNMFRVFGLFNTGVFTPWGTKAWVSATHQDYDLVYSNRGKIRKGAYNAKIYQPIGSNGDFIAIAGNYNVNRNNNVPDIPLSSFPATKAEREQIVARCQLAPAVAGAADKPNACGTNYLENMNPSNTGSIRVTSSFHLAHNLVLTVDPDFEYVKANGGLSAGSASEGFYSYKNAAGQTIATDLTGYINNGYYFGRDLNGDGDTLDSVELYHPSQTVTHRYLLTSSLRWDITDTQSVRFSYAHDYGRHRQTGELGYLLANGQAKDPFPINAPITDVNGNVVEKRNRKSFAILDQFSAEYRGQFLDEKLTVDLGGRLPYFKRKLNNYCFTSSSAGFVDCVAGGDAAQAEYETLFPNSTPPISQTLKYHKFLPNANVTYDFTSAFHAYASYSKGLQVPGTDNLYQALYYTGSDFVSPAPETTDNFDAGLRYTSSKIQAQVGPWYTIYTNRLASSYDPINDISTYRNLGKVDKYGLDASIAYQPIPEVSLYAFGSYLKSKIRDDVQTGTCSAANAAANPAICPAAGDAVFDQTKGKRESGSPVYTVGGRVQVNVNPVEFGIQVKHTGKRYVNDQNLPIYSCSSKTVYDQCPGTATQVYAATTPGYTTVDLNARLNLGWAGLNDKTYLQLNVTNLFDEFYVGSFGGSTSTFSAPYAYIGAPRTVSATLNVAF